MPILVSRNKAHSGLFLLAFAGMIFCLGANGLVLCRSLAEDHRDQVTVERYCLKTPETHHPQDHHHDQHRHGDNHHQGDHHHPVHESGHSHEHSHEEDCQDTTLPSWAILRQLAEQDSAPVAVPAVLHQDSPLVFSVITKHVPAGSLPPPPIRSGPLTEVVLLI